MYTAQVDTSKFFDGSAFACDYFIWNVPYIDHQPSVFIDLVQLTKSRMVRTLSCNVSPDVNIIFGARKSRN